jgi:hypothetical protein
MRSVPRPYQGFPDDSSGILYAAKLGLPPLAGLISTLLP